MGFVFVWPGILYSCHVYAYIMNAEKMTIYAKRDELANKNRTGYTNLDTNGKRIQAVSYVCLGPVLRRLDNTPLERSKLPERCQSRVLPGA